MNKSQRQKYQVLILDAEFPNALAVLRSLGRAGCVCDLGSSVKTPICQYSRYANRIFNYPDPLLDKSGFIDFIIKLVQTTDYDLIIPMTERSVIPLTVSDRMNPWRKQLAIAPADGLAQVLDKSKTLNIAEALDIPVPFSSTIRSTQELLTIHSHLEYPVVLKPVRSVSNKEKSRQLSVNYAFNHDELVNLGKGILIDNEILIQQYVKGEGVGIELLADHGEIVYAFQHKRLHELPLTGGGSCYRKSVEINPVLLDAAKKLVSALRWHGVAMVEFKWQPDTHEYWLMEINGRFWGSLPLGCAAGADFPGMLFDLLVNNKRPTSNKYVEGIYCRKLSADISWYEQILRRSGDPRLVTYPSTNELINDLLFILHPTKHFFDVQSWSDPMPGLVDFYEIAKNYFQRFIEIATYKTLAIWHCSNWMQKRLDRRLQTANDVLFLCFGNINRSALARAIADKHIINSQTNFDSAGFYEIEDRSADQVMTKIAAEYQIDLTQHKSKTINENMLNKANVVFVMEIKQYLDIKSLYPKYIDKVFLLGSSIKMPNISDPFNKSENIYRQCYTAIESALLSLYRFNDNQSA